MPWVALNQSPAPTAPKSGWVPVDPTYQAPVASPTATSTPTPAPRPGGVLGFLSNTAPGLTAQDLLSNTLAGQDTSHASDLNSKLNDLNSLLKANSAKYPQNTKANSAAVQNNLGEMGGNEASIANNPQYNRTTEQGVGDVLGTGADILAAGTLPAAGASSFALSGLPEGVSLASKEGIQSLVKSLPSLLKQGSVTPTYGEGALEWLKSISPLLATSGGVGAVTGTAGALQGNSSATETVKNTAESALLNLLTTGGIEGISALKNSLRPITGPTTIGQIFSNPSSDVNAGLLGKTMGTEEGQYNGQYLKNMQKAKQSANEYDLSGVRKEIQNTLQNNFKINSTVASNEELNTVRNYLNMVRNGVSTSASSPEYGSEITLEQRARDVYDKYFGDQAATPAEQMRDILYGNKFKSAATAPNSGQVQQTLQALVDNNGSVGLNFEGTGISPKSKEAGLIQTAYDTIMSKDKSTVDAIDGLKQDIDGFISNLPANKSEGRANAVLTMLRSKIATPLIQGNPEYAQAMKDYIGYLAGKKMSPLVPTGTLGKVLEGGAVGLGALHPALLLPAAGGSPFLRGATVRGAGYVDRLAGKATVPIANRLRQNPVALVGILRQAGIIP